MRRQRVLITGCLLLAASLLTACDDLVTDVRGSGDLVTETREVSGFDEIEVAGSGSAIVEVTGTESLAIEAEDNIMPMLTAEVVDGRLELGSSSSFSTTKGITYTITAAALEGVAVTGSGDITASNVDADSFDVEIAGSGNVEPVGTAGDLSVEIAGSGDYRGEDFVAPTGSVEIAGSGNAVVNVTEVLDVTIAGSGNVEYLGSPTVSEDIAGSGSVSGR